MANIERTIPDLQARREKIAGGIELFERILESNGTTLFESKLQITPDNAYLDTLESVGKRRAKIVGVIQEKSMPTLLQTQERVMERINELTTKLVTLTQLRDRGNITVEEFKLAENMLSASKETSVHVTPKIDKPAISAENANRIGINQRHNNGNNGRYSEEEGQIGTLTSSPERKKVKRKSNYDRLIEILSKTSKDEPLKSTEIIRTLWPDEIDNAALRRRFYMLVRNTRAYGKANIVTIRDEDGLGVYYLENLQRKSDPLQELLPEEEHSIGDMSHESQENMTSVNMVNSGSLNEPELIIESDSRTAPLVNGRQERIADGQSQEDQVMYESGPLDLRNSVSLHKYIRHRVNGEATEDKPLTEDEANEIKNRLSVSLTDIFIRRFMRFGTLNSQGISQLENDPIEILNACGNQIDIKRLLTKMDNVTPADLILVLVNFEVDKLWDLIPREIRDLSEKEKFLYDKVQILKRLSFRPAEIIDELQKHLKLPLNSSNQIAV